MEIKFYLSERGDNPILEYINKLNGKHAKKIIKKIEYLKECGIQRFLQSGDVKKMEGCEDIFELKARFSNARYRIFSL